ncbi:VanZ family protein [Phascolarctobacterium succinatutens]|uniref:VanZ family protein n=1 Tax=Phascolarctobacterium succinatutens TaxID=626940 RepID=UPI003AB1C1FE
MKYFWFLLAACFVGIIFYNSLLPLRQSSQLSGWVTALTQLLAQHLDIRLTGDVEHHIRKLAHFCEFALLGLLLCHSFSALGVSNRTATGYILFLALFAAVLDEYIQSFSPGRASRVKDVLLDFSGVFCAWLEYRIWEWSARK